MKSHKDNIIIGIDTSCYTTSIAAINLDKEVILNEKMMLKVSKNSKGLRQSEAVFQHINNLGVISDNILNEINKYNVVGVCVSKKPRPLEESYMPVFNVGYNFAKMYASLSNCEFYETTHQENHIEASLYKSDIKNKQRFISVHMSGGTTEILLTERKNNKYNIQKIGGTKDISFGQLLDRVGLKLGYRFPCGKYIDEIAVNSELKMDKGLKTSVNEGFMNISGLENQVNKLIEENIDKEYVCKITLNAIIKNIEKAIIYLCKVYDIEEVVFAGGVSASEYISKEVRKRLSRKNIKTYFTESKYATDSGVGCALIGVDKYEAKSIKD